MQIRVKLLTKQSEKHVWLKKRRNTRFFLALPGPAVGAFSAPPDPLLIRLRTALPCPGCQNHHAPQLDVSSSFCIYCMFIGSLRISLKNRFLFSYRISQIRLDFIWEIRPILGWLTWRIGRNTFRKVDNTVCWAPTTGWAAPRPVGTGLIWHGTAPRHLICFWARWQPVLFNLLCHCCD